MDSGPGDTTPGGQAPPPAAVIIEPEEPRAYPEHWEADVVLRDGGTCHLRPIGPQDARRLREFHSQLSAQTVYYRYFAPYPELTDRDVRRFTELDHDSRVALIATVADEIIAIGSYDRISATEAEVAFTVRDDHQSRGLGSVLLEHLAAAARERGIDRFVADVLPGNRKMLTTFAMAGYKVAQEMEEGFVRLAFDIEPTDAQRAVARGSEQRAEARSIARLFHPRSVAVVGASRRKDSLGNQLLRSLTAGGFTGRVFAIHPTAEAVQGVKAYRTLHETPTAVDLAVVAVPADAVDRVIDDAAAARVHGLIVISSGFAELGDPGAERQRELVAKVRGAGMRLVGPNALGLINTDSRTRLFAALTKEQARRGRIGIFCQSAAIGTVILERFWSRRPGRLVVRVGGQQGRRRQSGRHALLGRRPLDQRHRALPGRDRQSEQGHPGRPRAVAAQADRGAAGGQGEPGLPPGRHRPAHHPSRQGRVPAVRPRGIHRRGVAGRAAGRVRHCSPASRCRRATGWRSSATPWSWHPGSSRRRPSTHVSVAASPA